MSGTIRLALVGLLVATATGCATQYKFGIEAIKQRDATMPQRSYRLVDARPDAQPGDARFARVARDVETALSSRGMYAAPEGTTPQLVIEVDYGISAPMVKRGVRSEPVYLEMPGAIYGGIRSRDTGTTGVTQPQYIGMRDLPYTITTYQKFFRLTAREGEPAVAGATPRQVWSVLVTNEDASDNLPEYTRMMVAAAMDSIGTDSAKERRVVLTRRDGRVTFVEQGTGST